ncbi:MAG TPA: hypothetical protein VD867_18245 [Burkholderiales bacterium]|nr:hypothetical protein [Burkholderiales bacterium]
MQKPISPRVHGMIDYSTSAAVAAAPAMFKLPRPATALFTTLAATYTGISAFTDYPLAVKRTIPFKAHGAAELMSALALPALPWVLGFARHRTARNLCFGLAAMTVIVAALTDWDAED